MATRQCSNCRDVTMSSIYTLQCVAIDYQLLSSTLKYMGALNNKDTLHNVNVGILASCSEVC